MFLSCFLSFSCNSLWFIFIIKFLCTFLMIFFNLLYFNLLYFKKHLNVAYTIHHNCELWVSYIPVWKVHCNAYWFPVQWHIYIFAYDAPPWIYPFRDTVIFYIIQCCYLQYKLFTLAVVYNINSIAYILVNLLIVVI